MTHRLSVFIAALALVGCSDGGRGTGPSPSDEDGMIVFPGTDGGVGDGAVLPPECSGMQLNADGVLDVDVKAVHVTGTVTLNGQPMPSGARGRLTFVAKKTKDATTVTIATAGAATYDLLLPPATYDVAYTGEAQGCTGATTPQVPCNGGTIKKALALTVSGALDLDVPAVKVSGTVTLDGAAFPTTTTTRGTLGFLATGTENGFSAGTLGTSGAASYGVTLLAGTYDVVYNGNLAGCSSSAVPPALPCNSGVVKAGAQLTANGALDLDVHAVKVTGTLTVNGAPFPTTTVSRGTVAFKQAGTGYGFGTNTLGTSGAASYGVTLFAGTYDVQYTGNEQACDGVTAPVLPCNAGILKPGAQLTSNGALDLDVPAVKVSGTVTVNGAAFPSATKGRGTLGFTNTTTKLGFSRGDFGTTGPAAFAYTLVPGTYDIQYNGNVLACDGTSAPALPCNSGPIKTGAQITSSGALDLDVPAAKVTGTITLNGATFPTTTINRGNVSFTRAGTTFGYAVGVTGLSGAAAYAVTLVSGTYDVGYTGNGQGCASGTTTAPPLPCNAGVIKTGAQIASSGALDLDVRAVKVSGTVTFNGAAFPTGTSTRGALELALVGGSGVARSLALSGPAAYALTILPGNYVVAYHGDAQQCTGASPAILPCARELVLGCD